MERIEHYEETKVVTEHPVVADHAHVTTDKHHKKTKKTKKDKHVTNDPLHPKKSVGTKIKEFFTGRKDNGIIYQNGLPIAGLNGPIVQPMGAPIRQPAEIHPVATVMPTPVNTAHIPGQHVQGPTTTTYGPAPPLGPGMAEGYSRTTTTTEYIQPGAEIVQTMNAVAQPTGLGAIVQPAGVIIAKKDKKLGGLKDGYLQDRHVRDYPHDKIKEKPIKEKHHKTDKHHHDEIYTNTTEDYVAAPLPVEPVMPVQTVVGEPAPVIFTGPAKVLDETHHKDKHAKADKHHDKHLTSDMYQQPYALNTGVNQVIPGPNAVYQPTVLEQQPMPVNVMGPGYVAPPVQPMGYADQHIHHETLRHTDNLHHHVPTTTVVQEQPVILQQPGMAPSNQPVVRNHQQVPMTSQSGLSQGGLFQNDTARPVQTFTPIIQQNQPLTEAPILNQAALEQNAFAASGIRTKEGMVEARVHQAAPLTSTTKYTAPVGYEERKETVVHKDVKY